MSARAYHPSSGLIGYDQARFRAARQQSEPTTVLGLLAHAQRPGFGALLAQECYEEVEVPAMPVHVLPVFVDSYHVGGAMEGDQPEQHVFQPGDAVLIPAGTPSRWQLRGRTGRLLQFHLDPIALAAWNEGAAPVDLTRQARLRDPTILRLAQAAIREIKQPGPAKKLALDGIALSLGAHLLRHFDIRARPEPPIRGGLSPWQVRRVLEFMQDHHARDIALADLAALVGLSQFHFARAFRQSVGVPPAKHLGTIRLERARLLLANPVLPITDIALAVGYDSAQSLARAFRREYGTSPSDFRRERVR